MQRNTLKLKQPLARKAQAIALSHYITRNERSHRVYLLRNTMAPTSVKAHDAQYYSRFVNGVMICVKRNGHNTIRLWDR